MNVMFKTKYKCRLCGKKYTLLTPLDADAIVDCITNIQIGEPYINEEGIPFGRYDLHPCKKGSFGIADLQGFVRGEQEES